MLMTPGQALCHKRVAYVKKKKKKNHHTEAW